MEGVVNQLCCTVFAGTTSIYFHGRKSGVMVYRMISYARLAP